MTAAALTREKDQRSRDVVDQELQKPYYLYESRGALNMSNWDALILLRFK
jgi:hypothetical protein